jgi:hypothetical protein
MFLKNVLLHLSGSVDLMIQKVKLKGRNLAGGDLVTAVVKIRNLGESDSPETKVQIALTDDGTLSGPASTVKILATETVKSIRAGKKTKIKVKVILPIITPGDYYVVATVDPDETVNDTDTSNNQKVSKKYNIY